MRTVVLGYHALGCAGFEALMRHGFDPVAVVTHRDDPAENVWWRSLRDLAASAGVPARDAEDLGDAGLADLVASCRPDFLFSFYYRRMIPAPILSLAARGALNLHGSLLPRYRGRAPVNWVLVEGERETGVSLHYMTPRPDAGDLVDQERVPIVFEDTALTLFWKIEQAARRLLDRALPALRDGRAPATPLILREGSYRGGRGPADGLIRWSWPAMRVYNLIRAVTHPYPGAFTRFRGRRLMVWWALPVQRPAGARPGEILRCDSEGMVVAAGEGAVRLVTVQWEGQPELPASALAAGLRAEPGERLGDEGDGE